MFLSDLRETKAPDYLGGVYEVSLDSRNHVFINTGHGFVVELNAAEVRVLAGALKVVGVNAQGLCPDCQTVEARDD